jgi:hypothetical protein
MDFRQIALMEAMHLADIRGSHLELDSTAAQVVEDAEVFYKFIMGEENKNA